MCIHCQSKHCDCVKVACWYDGIRLLMSVARACIIQKGLGDAQHDQCYDSTGHAEHHLNRFVCYKLLQQTQQCYAVQVGA
jgi:hypothetical protein